MPFASFVLAIINEKKEFLKDSDEFTKEFIKAHGLKKNEQSFVLE